MQSPVLIVPGIGNSGPDHWQTRWQRRYPGCSRIDVKDWDQPECADWMDAIARAVRALGPHTRIVAHSLGCLAVAHWAAHAGGASVGGALLVAVPDPHGAAFPAEARGFAPLPQSHLGFPSLIVASDDDPYATPAHAQRCAAMWGSALHRAGALGHINAASGLGDWDLGWELANSVSQPGRVPVSAA